MRVFFICGSSSSCSCYSFSASDTCSCLRTLPRVHVRARSRDQSEVRRRGRTGVTDVVICCQTQRRARRHTQAHTRPHTDTLLTPTRSQCVLFTHPVPLCPLSHALPSVPVLKHPQRTIIFSHCGRKCLC